MDSALAARSVRNIKSELSFLLDANLLPASKHTEILSLLSSIPSLNSTTTPSTNLSSVQATQSHLAHTSANEKSEYPSVIPPPYQSSASPAPPPRTNSSPPQPPELCRAIAAYPFAPTDKGDMTLAKDDTISVTEYTNTEWWKGKNLRTGEVGIFPRSYTRPADESVKSGIMPVDVANGGGEQQVQQQPSKAEAQGKKFGKKLGNAAIFGAGATIGSNIVNGIF